jgi:hypothetical protein
MSSRVVVVILLALAITPMAHAGDSSTEVLPHRAVTMAAKALRPMLTVSDLFAEVRASRSEILADGTMVADAPSVDVVVMRVTPDGGVETSCVHDEESVNAFLDTESKKKRVITAAPQEK